MQTDGRTDATLLNAPPPYRSWQGCILSGDIRIPSVRRHTGLALSDCMTLRTTPLKSELTLRTTGEGGAVTAVAVGVSATREAERASDHDGVSLAMNCTVVKHSPKLLATFAKTEQGKKCVIAIRQNSIVVGTKHPEDDHHEKCQPIAEIGKIVLLTM